MLKKLLVCYHYYRLKRIYIILLLLVLFFLFDVGKDFFVKKVFGPKNVEVPIGSIETKLAPNDIEIVAEKLNIPWEIAFLPSGELLVTERGGKLLKIGKETRTIAEIKGVSHIGEGGLLGMALDPKFSDNNFIYLYSTTGVKGDLKNRVERYKLNGEELLDSKVILDGIKGSSNHDGGRISFGPDGLLYITTGDAEEPKLAQDKNSFNGKILRIKKDGGIPEDNPFRNAVYSMGHRNPQGIAWDKNGNLWETEHGPSGAQTGNDEVNMITKGGNYGWPDIKGQITKDGMIPPIIESGKSDTWAPSGMVIAGDTLFFAGLRGEALYELDTISLRLTSNFKSQYGRLRTVSSDKEGNLYIITSNKDGRGKPKDGDDKIIKIPLNKL